jgi:HK97 family phage major capsid protein
VSFTDVIDRPGASALIPTEQAREIIQLLPETSVAMRLARRAPNMSAHQRQVPVLSVLPMAYFVSSGGLKQTTKTGWEGLMLTAEEIAVIVPIHQSVLDDSAYPLWNEIRPQVAAAIGLTLDRAVFFSTNKPTTWPTGVNDGARATLPASSMVVTRGTPAAQGGIAGDLSNLYTAVERKGYEVSGLLLNPALYRGFLRQARNTQGDQLAELIGGDVYGFEPTFGLRGGWPAPGANVTEGFAGDFSQMIIAIREDMNWLISSEAVISDEDGAVVLNLFQADSVALRVVFRVAMQISEPVTPEQPTKANRYPFAVIQGTGAVSDEAAAEAAAEDEPAETTRRARR